MEEWPLEVQLPAGLFYATPCPGVRGLALRRPWSTGRGSRWTGRSWPSWPQVSLGLEWLQQFCSMCCLGSEGSSSPIQRGISKAIFRAIFCWACSVVRRRLFTFYSYNCIFLLGLFLCFRVLLCLQRHSGSEPR